jgi:NAD(P)-dependent dehydrogenase (short-subunit alcohol dehydrogenase family)
MSQEKVALITGVSSGIGRAIAGLLSQRGFRVFGTARGKVEPKGPLEAVELISLHVRDDDSVTSCVRSVENNSNWMLPDHVRLISPCHVSRSLAFN